MERGWSAKGRLREHWAAVGGRDGLADATGIQRSTISGYNSGRLPLGRRNAEVIARALDVTIYDLGAPTAEEVAGRSATVADRVAALEAEAAWLAASEKRLQAVERGLRELRLRVRRLLDDHPAESASSQ